MMGVITEAPGVLDLGGFVVPEILDNRTRGTGLCTRSEHTRVLLTCSR
jgi:hypothetical protein